MPWGTKGLLPRSAPLQIADSEKTWSKNVIRKRDPRQSRVGFALENALENALEHLFLPPSACCPTSPLPPFAFFCTTCPLQTGLSRACCRLRTFLLAPRSLRSTAFRAHPRTLYLELAPAFRACSHFQSLLPPLALAPAFRASHCF